MREQWREVNEILASALERSPEERLDFVRAACGEDDALRAEIESLLAHANAADTLLEGFPASDLFSATGGVLIGTRIGAYRIVGEVGQGGMAAVYQAERADQEFHKRVAIKMVKPGPNPREIIRRFRNERQTLAALDHPYIVKLLDGGTTEEGWPYLVMDFVEGVPIDQYCDENRLTIPERLEIFRSVCEVTQYAHQRMVIHRDLKPSNILITGDGVPRLLDFGIAKLLDPEEFKSTLVTTGDWRPLTPEYASPEQILGKPITTATDIYSLGVLLCELLTGQRPYHGLPGSRREVEQLVCEHEPTKPSTIVSGTQEDPSASGTSRPGPAPELVSQARRTNPKALRRMLQGDLDTIVLTALNKEPQRRYASAEEFSQDIARYLSGSPVRARRPTMVYRTGKFLRRHRESVAAVALVVAAAASLGIWRAVEISRGKASEPASSVGRPLTRSSVAVLGFKDLSGRGDTAWLSTALSEMLATELAAGEKLRVISGETVARSKIDLKLPEAESLGSDTLRRVRKDLGSDFVVVGAYLDVGGKAGGEIRLDVRLEDTAKGETIATVSETGTENGLLELVSRSGASLRRELGVVEVARSETAGIRASVPSSPEALRFYAEGLSKLRSFDALAARDLFIRAVATDPAFPLAHSALAKAWQTLGYDSKASEESKKAMELARDLSREDHLLVEARYYETSRDWNKAIETYRAMFTFFPDNLDYGLSLAAAETSGGRGKDALQTVAAMSQTGAAAADDPRIDLARSEAASSLGDNRVRRDAAESAAAKAASRGATLLVARARAQECRALANLGQNDKAKIVCEEGRRIYMEAGDRAGLATILHSTAEVPLNQDDLVTAEKLYREALALTQLVGDKLGTGRELVNLALIFKKRGDLTTALALNKESLRNYTEAGDKNGMAGVTGNIGGLFFAQGKLREALEYYENALKLSNELENKHSAALAITNIGETLAREGDLQKAAANYEQALAIHRELGERNYYAAARVRLGEVLVQQGKLREARKLYLDSLAEQEKLGEKGSAAETRLALAELESDSSNPAAAERLEREALAEFTRLNEAQHELLAQTALLFSLLEQGKVHDARAAMAATPKLPEGGQDVGVRLSWTLAQARLLAAENDLLGAERFARQLLGEARKLGFLQFQFEASLALGEIQLKGKSPAAGYATLRELGTTAQNLQFKLIARKAASAIKPRGS
jgi:serine/threonine protein kinase/tetratricopeptide (TPR) repeat protein